MHSHFSEFIQRELEVRQKKNPRYSIRAFARDLNISHQSLAAILKREQGLSTAMAEKIAPLLNLSTLERKVFVASVQALHDRTAVGKKKALQELEKLSAELHQKNIGREIFKSIADWEHNAILAMTDLADFSSDPEYLAAQLSISKQRAKQAFDRLVSLGLIKESAEGNWKRTNTVLGFNSGEASLAFQKHYLQVTQLAAEKIKNTSVKEREFSTLFMSLTESDYQYIVEELSRFRKQLLYDISKRGGDSDRIYCLSLQLFPIVKDF